MMERKYIVDTTLRDGEQAPGVVFFQSEKIEIAGMLDKKGFEELEIGTPSMGAEEVSDMKAIVVKNFNFLSIAWCRALIADIDLAVETGVKAVNISFPVSDLHLAAMQKSREWVLNRMLEVIPYALVRFEKVFVGAQDASRADVNFLNEFIHQALSLGAVRVRIADTVGIMTPVKVMNLFTGLCNDFPDTDFEFHAHNDLGMATANALTALQFGASGVSCTVNGLGERAGNAALEELVVALGQENIEEEKYKLSIISKLSEKVSFYSKQEVHSTKPIVGENAFVHETGIHTNCILKNKLAYQPFDEARVGKKHSRIVFGKHSGRAGLEHFFRDKGIQLNALQLMLILNGVKELAIKTRTILSDDHIMQIYDKLFASS